MVAIGSPGRILNVGLVDWLVIAAYGCVFVGVGAFYSRQNQTADDFLPGGRRMSPFAVGLSLFATLVSTLSYLGNPGEMIAHGPMMTTQIMAHPLIFVIVGYGLIPLLTAPLFVLFFLALFVKWANAGGAWLGLLSSIVTAVLIAYSKDFGLPFVISFVWMMPCSLLVGIVVGTVGSAIMPSTGKAS